MPLAHGLDIVGYEELDNGAFRVGDLIARPFADNLEWGLGRIEGSLRDPARTLHVGRLAVASLQQVAESEKNYTTCTDGRFRLLLLTNRLIPVRFQLLADNMGTGFMMAEMLGEKYYEDPTAPLDERIEAVAEDLENHDEKLSTHDDCGGWAQFAALMGNVVAFSRNEGFQSRNEQVLGDEFHPPTFLELASRLEGHLDNRPYLRYGPDIIWRLVRGRGDLEAVSTLHNTGPYGVHGHQEKIGLWLGESITNLALNQRLLSEVGGGTEDAQAFGINQHRMRKIAEIIGRGDPELISEAMHAGVMGTHAGQGTLAYNLPSYLVERVT